MKQFLFLHLLFVFIMSYSACNSDTNDSKNTDNKETEVKEKTTDNASKIEESKKEDASLKSVTLPGGKEIKFAAESFEEKIISFLNGDNVDLSTGYILDGIQFDSNSKNISNDSKIHVSNLAALLDAFVDAEIKIIGHTPSEGDETSNKKLSLDRANSIKDLLVAEGIDAARITTEGLGSDQPIADNATEEGKAKNRRVELFFTKR